VLLLSRVSQRLHFRYDQLFALFYDGPLRGNSFLVNKSLGYPCFFVLLPGSGERKTKIKLITGPKLRARGALLIWW